MPLMSACGTVIQSSRCSMSLLVRRTPATRPAMVSLKTSISMADVAPSPAMMVSGLRSMAMATMTMTETKAMSIFSTPQNVW